MTFTHLTPTSSHHEVDVSDKVVTKQPPPRRGVSERRRRAARQRPALTQRTVFDTAIVAGVGGETYT